MFKGGVETLEFFSVEIAKYFEKIGHRYSGIIFFYRKIVLKNCLITIISIKKMNSWHLHLTLKGLKVRQDYIRVIRL